MPQTPEQRAASLIGKIGAHTKWSRCEDKTKATQAARDALEARFLNEAGGDPQRAEHVRRAYYTRLALKSAAARRAKRGAA